MAKSKLVDRPEDKGVTENILQPEQALARSVIEANIGLTEKFSTVSLPSIVTAAKTMAATLLVGGKVLLFGNGGSAAEAEHFAAELVGSFKLRGRRPLKAMALTSPSSVVTALGNDYGFEEIYSRQVQAFADRGDVVVAISTSGRSRDVLRGLEAARRQGAKTIGLTGASGGELASICDYIVQVPSDDVQRIQECHTLVVHVVCELIEKIIAEQE